MPASVTKSRALTEFEENLAYAREFVRGGQRLEQLKVGAFDLADIYRAAWVQAVSSLDHWIRQEIRHRVLALMLNPSASRPQRFGKLQISMAIVEAVRSTDQDIAEEAINTLLERDSYQNPGKIQEGLGYVSDVRLWSGVADILSRGGSRVTENQVRERLAAITDRRHQIAHSTDRVPGLSGRRTPMTGEEAASTIEWLYRLATATYELIGPPPPVPLRPVPLSERSSDQWTEAELEDALAPYSTVVDALHAHGYDHGAHFPLGKGRQSPSVGSRYLIRGDRRSLWSIIASSAPSLVVSFAGVAQWDQTLALAMVAEVRKSEALDRSLRQYTDQDLMSKWPGIPLSVIADSADALPAILRALDLTVR